MEGRLRRLGEGESTDPAPGAGRGRSRGCGERRGGPRDAREGALSSPTVPETAQLTAQSEEADWPGRYQEGWPGPEARSRDPEAAVAETGEPAHSRVCFLGRARVAAPAIRWREGRVPWCPLLTPVCGVSKIWTARSLVRAQITSVSQEGGTGRRDSR